MRELSLSVTTLLLLLLVQCGFKPVAVDKEPPPLESKVLVLNSDNFTDSILIDKRVAMVEFYSPTCGACIAVQQTVEAIADSFHNRALIAQVHVQANTSLTSSNNIRKWPTFIFFKGGIEYDRFVGVATFEELAAIITKGFNNF